MSNMIDLTGKRFGRLVVIGASDNKSNNGRMLWNCKCDCGNSVQVITGNLTKVSPQKSCGCSRRKNIIGVRFGRLTVIKQTKERTPNRSVIWICSCDCGNLTRVSHNELVHTGTKSCGCLRDETARELLKKRIGPLHPRWRDDITNEERHRKRRYRGYDDWRNKVYERDGYKCIKCGDSSGGNLNAHHIESYAKNPKVRTVLKNGITLCEKCHKDLHHIYGHDVGRRNLISWLNE